MALPIMMTFQVAGYAQETKDAWEVYRIYGPSHNEFHGTYPTKQEALQECFRFGIPVMRHSSMAAKYIDILARAAREEGLPSQR